MYHGTRAIVRLHVLEELLIKKHGRWLDEGKYEAPPRSTRRRPWLKTSVTSTELNLLLTEFVHHGWDER